MNYNELKRYLVRNQESWRKELMRVLSLFDGMSCGQIALNRLGIKVDKYYASEIDKYAIQITQKNYPDTIQVGDITKLNPNDFKDIDLIMAGSPCQGFSFAGKQLAFDDPRSALFFEFIRLLKAIKPKYFLLENVRMKKEYLEVITEQVSQCYPNEGNDLFNTRIEPILINSALVSAQNRVRYYWTNIPKMKQPNDRNIILKDILEDNYIADREKSYCIDANYFRGGNLKRYFLRCSRQLVFLNNDYKEFRKLYPEEVESLQTVPKGYTHGVSNMQRYKMLGNGWTVDVICHILKNMEKRIEER